MTQAITQIAHYDAFWQSLRTRRRTVRQQKGLDLVAGRWFLRLRHARRGLGKWIRMGKQIDALGQECSVLDDKELDDRLLAVREAFCRQHATEAHLLNTMAILREMAWRVLGQKPYVVQLAGALAIYHGQIVQMITGEGKTLAAVLATVPLAWSRPSVHIVTANGYLAERDAREMGPLYARAGVAVGHIVPTVTDSRHRMSEYRKSVVYTTQKELVADWLRDQLRLGSGRDVTAERLAVVPSTISGRRNIHVLIPGLHAVIVDEADAVLIDQATTPLIIASSRGSNQAAEIFTRAAELVRSLQRGTDYRVEPSLLRVKLTEQGKRQVVKMLTDADQGTWRAARRRHELVEQALGAIQCFRRGEQYELVDGRVMMIDQFTGRFMPDRQWQHGMHQALEAKEGLPVTEKGDTLASLSFQRFFRLYPFLAGMTGTAVGGRREFEQTYQVPVRLIPPNRPVYRSRWPRQIFTTAQHRWDAVLEAVGKLHGQGRPVLIGTRTVQASQHLSKKLEVHGFAHQVLNAVHHEQEAQIVAGAGQRGAITVATNLAGRGTDIKLGPGVAELGGLHVILTELHEARRIDEQLIGRAGRQGDPGSAQVFPSFEDDLVVKHCPGILNWAKLVYAHRPGVIRSVFAQGFFMLAQKRAERQAFTARKAVLRRDDWLDQAVPSS